ncbi:SURF1 family cytochrome oxidase biogenesis protein [Humidisolicoccus flavus]|uniref:SURF1 family cytochrome oxidase biogenesis protein n=1 Tax=Humidisolicoccus flavus TaxID=3111414 RepID=UPI00324D5AF0
MLALLRSSRWLGYLALTTLFAIVCCAFGAWQWNRREEAVAAIDRLERNYELDPSPLSSVLPEIDSYDEDDQWVPVLVEGEYLVDEALYIRGRVRGSQIGFNVLVPFQTTVGTIFYIDRGFIVEGTTVGLPESEPVIPEDEVTVVARLRQNEGDIVGRGAPEGQVVSVNLPTLAQTQSLPTYTGAYGLLVSENGAFPADVAPAVRPVLDEGPHLSYTFQWFVFALMGFIGFFWALRQEQRRLSEDESESAAAIAENRPKIVRTKRRDYGIDADVEDEILDEEAEVLHGGPASR